jgi:hypothetical protein
MVVFPCDPPSAFLAARVARDKGTGLRCRQAEPHGLLVASTELGRRRELGERAWRRCQAAQPVELDEEVPIGREAGGHIESPAGAIGLGLLQPVARGQVLGLGLDERHCHGLALGAHLDAQRVVGAPARATPGLALQHVHRARRLLAADQVLRPAAGMERRVDQLGAGIRLTQRHAGGHRLGVSR